MVKERWPSIWKTYKHRIKHENQRETMPTLNLDSVKLSLQRQESKIKWTEKVHCWHATKMIEAAPYNRACDSKQLKTKQAIRKAVQIAHNPFAITKILPKSPTMNDAEVSDHQYKDTHSCLKNSVKIDCRKRIYRYRQSSPGVISPRKIYLGGGFYNAIAIYDKNAKIDIIKVGETRLGIMDCVINRRETTAATRTDSLPRLRNTLVDGIHYMPEELKCGKISKQSGKSKDYSRTTSKCRECNHSNVKNDTTGPKKIKLFLNIDV